MGDMPNIILFTTDQHRGDHLSIAGHPVVETPNIDAMIGHGAYFPNAYTEIPSTTGARRIVHSGKCSYNCGLIGYSSEPWNPQTTLAQELAQAGYHCFNVGFRNMHPRRKLFGYHHVLCHDLRENADDYWDWLKEQLGPQAHEVEHGVDFNGWAARPWHLEERFHPTNWTTRASLELIKKRDPTKPFFLWVSHHRPHSPYDPPQSFWDMYIDRELPEIPVGDWAAENDIPNPGLGRTAWRGRLTPAQNQRGRAGYMGCITHIDYQFGFFVTQLGKLLGGADNTLILFTADHGDMMGDHHLHRKTYAYEGSARIPFLVQYPKSMEFPTGTFDQVVGLQDVMPTILDVAGVHVPDDCTGRSVLDAVNGLPWREFIHGEHSPCYAGEQAVQYLTDSREKYMWFPMTGREQFFDLTSDRSELHDLSQDASCADRVSKWRMRLVKLLAERGDGFSDGQKLIVRKERYSPVVSPE